MFTVNNTGKVTFNSCGAHSFPPLIIRFRHDCYYQILCQYFYETGRKLNREQVALLVLVILSAEFVKQSRADDNVNK